MALTLGTEQAESLLLLKGKVAELQPLALSRAPTYAMVVRMTQMDT